jgi:hypothetical protein
MSQTSLKDNEKEKGERSKKKKEVRGEEKEYGPRRRLVVIQGKDYNPSPLGGETGRPSPWLSQESKSNRVQYR